MQQVPWFSGREEDVGRAKRGRKGTDCNDTSNRRRRVKVKSTKQFEKWELPVEFLIISSVQEKNKAGGQDHRTKEEEEEEVEMQVEQV